MHAEMIRLHHHGEAVRLDHVQQQLRQLADGFLLDLRSPHDPLREARVFRKANQVGMLVGHDTDPQPPHDWAEVMAAGTANGNWANDHQLVEAGYVREFGDGGRWPVATAEGLIEVHLGHATRRFLRVVVVLGVDHQAVEHGPHLAGNFLEQRFVLAGLDERGDVVVCVEPHIRRSNPAADTCRHRRIAPETDRRRGITMNFVLHALPCAG
jgi:hypothetical protein